MSARLRATSRPSSAPLIDLFPPTMSTMVSSQVAPQPAAQTATKPLLPDAVVELQQSMKVLEAAALVLSRRKSASSKTRKHAKLLIAAGNRFTSAIVAACAQRPGDLYMLAKVHFVVAQEYLRPRAGVYGHANADEFELACVLLEERASPLEVGTAGSPLALFDALRDKSSELTRAVIRRLEFERHRTVQTAQRLSKQVREEDAGS
ncbi:hypothetical protein BKA62DRAFT_671427 [Auriculariales sp. MPI-PUGE-AT-0066]|nr:hypothetical protein BKA62DRAFT_671427 [Auriculariales sp. MPI-PUGE-AT-0066]